MKPAQVFVKRFRRFEVFHRTSRGACGLALLALTTTSGCGYEPLYGGERPTERLHVIAAPTRIARPEALSAALDGARAELSRAGVLGSGDGYPQLFVELLRLDELSSGIVAREVGGETLPVARGSAVGVVGRGWVIEIAGADALRDTGDLRRTERVAAGVDATSDSVAHDEAVRNAAHELGRAIARSVLGEPEPAREEL